MVRGGVKDDEAAGRDVGGLTTGGGWHVSVQGVNPNRILKIKFWNYYTKYIGFIMLV